MQELKNIEELTDKVSERIENNTFYLIAIDGVDGCGKSTIAGKLSSSLDIKYIELDEDHLQKHKGGYVDYIKYPVLLKDLQGLKKQNKPVIVDGICILEILERLNFVPALHIYIKKLALGLWLDGEYILIIHQQLRKK